MKVAIAVLMAISLCCGCGSTQCQHTYQEGTSLTLGLYLPLNGTIYGLQFCNYLAGKKIVVNTNQHLTVESQHSVTNSSFGVIGIVDSSITRVGYEK